MLMHERLTETIIAAVIEVHRQLGPGLLESAYEVCLCRELELRGLTVRCQLKLPIEYKGISLDAGYRIDMIVQDAVVLEHKAIEKVLPVHEAQLLTYLKLTRKRVDLLINFNVPVLKDGIVRRVL